MRESDEEVMLRGLSGKRYQLEAKAFNSGGEGDVFGIIGVNDKVIKIYHPGRINDELEEKLKAMVRKPPSAAVLSQVAWPLDVVYDDRGSFCGFVMPRLSITAELREIYTYPPRTNITYQQKLVLAQNICVVIFEVHKAGYVFGDFNPGNIGINTNTGTVAFLDTDSYHITDGSKTYRCKVCLDGYVAPELLKKCEAYKKDAYACAPLPTFTMETDNFALAIHIFKLLMNGFTPFNGIKETERASTASPGVGNQAIKRDEYCFKPGNKPLSPAVPSLEVLPKEIADLFTRAFMYGKVDPKERPSAVEWYKGLSNYESSLIQCSRNRSHLFKRGLSTCPWCEVDEKYRIETAPKLTQKGFTTSVNPTIHTSNISGHLHSSSITTPQNTVLQTPRNIRPVAVPSSSSTTSKSNSLNRKNDKKHVIFKTIFIVSLITLALVSWWTLHYTSNMNYHGNFGEWVDNAGIKLWLACLFVGVAYGLNYHNGFEIEINGYSFWMFVFPIVYAIIYTVIYKKYASDSGDIIAIPLLFISLYFMCFLVGWITMKISSLF